MQYRITSQFEGYVTSLYLFLEGQPIHMSYDGEKTFKSTDYIESSDATIDVVMRIYGLNGTGWSLNVTVNRDDMPSYEKKLEEKGQIKKKQTDLLQKEIELTTQKGE